MNNLYSYILFNLNNLSVPKLEVLLLELELDTNALFLKHKFNDSRSINELKELIKDTYSIV